MQLVVLILVAVILLEDRMPLADAPESSASAWWALAATLLPSGCVLTLQWYRVRRAERAMDAASRQSVDAFDRADRVMRTVPWIALLSTAIATFGFGWLESVRGVVGDWPAIDELLAMGPACFAMTCSWWIHEPLERRVREASLVRALDAGLPIPTWRSKATFVAGRVRVNILLLLAPLACVMLLSELIEPRVEATWPAFAAAGGREAVTLAIAGLVYVLSPLIARMVLHLEPLPPGEMRDDLQAVCDGCSVRVREIFVWRTDHGMVNGAVMGLVAPLRYVMLTDGLLELLPRDELRAVMAHEIGHVRKRHLPWMLATLVALLTIASIAVDLPTQAIYLSIRDAGWDRASTNAAVVWLDRGAALVAAGLTLVLFGWVSRRVERQADSFAVQYLSRVSGSDQVTPGAVAAMRDALGSVARCAGVPRSRTSWRHGSIAWRQRYLGSLVGLSIHTLPIDRLIAVVKIGVACVLIALLVLLALEGPEASEPGGGDYHAQPRSFTEGTKITAVNQK